MLRLYNTLTRTKEDFLPIDPPKVGMYACGPTVYNYAHIGNFRAYVFDDLLRRYLRYCGFDVTLVMNITDVEDKIIRDAAAAGQEIREFTEPFTQAFFEDLKSLHIEMADHFPRATEHIEEMIALVQKLSEKGLAYESDGSVYYQIDRFPDYGKLSGLQAEGLQAGVRVDSDEYDKDNVRDFVLWKSNKGEAARWETPFGVGRPGWHLECSAMSMKYLGASFDIHCGGEDLVFPHHENEIAQSEGATGKPFARFWLHNRHLLVEGRKMSKSMGNFYTLRDLMDRGCNPVDIRYVLLSAHYRSTLDFSLKAVEQAGAARQRLLDCKRRLEEIRQSDRQAEGMNRRFLDKAQAEFEQAMDDDLDTPAALAAVFELVSAIHREADAGRVSSEDADRTLNLLDRFDSVLGVMAVEEKMLPEEIEALIEERTRARKEKDFARADAIRAELDAQGIVLEDGSGQTRWKWKTSGTVHS